MWQPRRAAYDAGIPVIAQSLRNDDLTGNGEILGLLGTSWRREDTTAFASMTIGPACLGLPSWLLLDRSRTR